jgi:hypothetical protein
MKKNITSAVLVMALLIFAGVGCSTNKISTQKISTQKINTQEKTYEIGDRGPAGGWIFYDKGKYDGGWRYLEAAPEDHAVEAKWGCAGKSIPDAKGTAVGTGKSNTQAIIKSCGESGIAAKVAADYRGGGKSDWFLPSKDELNLMYEYLYLKGVGGFADDRYDIYWSSSEEVADHAWHQYFDSGSQHYNGKHFEERVRAIRAF